MMLDIITRAVDKLIRVGAAIKVSFGFAHNLDSAC